MQTLFPSRPRWRERREVEKGGGEEYWRKVSLEEQDSFLPPPRQRHPHPTPPHPTPWPSHVTSWANKCSIQPGSQGKWLRGWAMPNESRDAGHYYCLPHPPGRRSAGQISKCVFKYLNDPYCNERWGGGRLWTFCSSSAQSYRNWSASLTFGPYEAYRGSVIHPGVCAYTNGATFVGHAARWSPCLCVFSVLTVFVCGFAGVTSGLGGTVVFLVELNKQFFP